MTSQITDRYFLPSVTRISDLGEAPFDVQPIPRDHWQSGQYVAAELTGRALEPFDLELADGRVGRAVPGDRLVGALGRRAATLQAVGSFEDVGDGLEIDLLTMAGVIGKCTSRSAFAGAVPSLRYLGHVHRDGRVKTMSDFVAPLEAERLKVPSILIIGTSMDAGKTLAAARLIRLLRLRGTRVLGAKLTGVGRYRDILAMADAGAEWIMDFVDAGLPSTVVPDEEFRCATGPLLARVNQLGPDVAVLEAGASPLEPYNGEQVVPLIADAVRMVVLCASDPYAAHGVMDAFDLQPTFISGRATSTTAGSDLTARLTGRPAIDLLDPDAGCVVAELLESAFSETLVGQGGFR
ncbi:MAG: hypothetical protein ACR2PK_01075 [Acidimicrobiales bacterium]